MWASALCLSLLLESLLVYWWDIARTCALIGIFNLDTKDTDVFSIDYDVWEGLVLMITDGNSPAILMFCSTCNGWSSSSWTARSKIQQQEGLVLSMVVRTSEESMPATCLLIDFGRFGKSVNLSISVCLDVWTVWRWLVNLRFLMEDRYWGMPWSIGTWPRNWTRAKVVLEYDWRCWLLFHWHLPHFH